MIEQIEKTFRRLGDRLPGGLSRPGDVRSAAATAIWAKPVGRALSLTAGQPKMSNR
jgi:hypothetical protein